MKEKLSKLSTSVSLDEVIVVAADSISNESLGTLVGVLSDAFIGEGRWQAQSLLIRAKLIDKLFDADFVEGLGGTTRLKSKRLIEWAFTSNEKEELPISLIMNRLFSLTSSGALNLFSESSANTMWKNLSSHSKFFSLYSTDNPVIIAELLSRLCGALDSNRKAGLFLGVTFKSAIFIGNCKAEWILKVLYLLAQTEEVAMLDDSKEQLLWQLQLELSELSTVRGRGESVLKTNELKKLIRLISSQEVKNQVLEHLKSVEEDGDDEDADEDADEEGNLAGFVTYSDEEEDEEGEEEEEEEEDDTRVIMNNTKQKRSRNEKDDSKLFHHTRHKDKKRRLRRERDQEEEEEDEEEEDRKSNQESGIISSQKDAKSRMSTALAALNV